MPIATAAIVAQVPYETAARQSPVRPGQRDLFPKEVVRLLERTSGVAWRRLHFGWFGRVSRFVPQGDVVVLGIRQPWRWWRRHCIAIRDGWIYDPNYPLACSIEKYERRNWIVEVVFQPGRQTKGEWIGCNSHPSGASALVFNGLRHVLAEASAFLGASIVLVVASVWACSQSCGYSGDPMWPFQRQGEGIRVAKAKILGKSRTITTRAST